jgi:hypothetical protein
METWKKVLHGYEFILWNFDRFDINSSLWVKQAFEAKKYAFAADYIRLYAVYNHGGIYLDMDIEVAKPFDELLNTELMLAFENDQTKAIEAGCFGAVKGHPYIKKCLDYHNRDFVNPVVFLPSIMRDILFDGFSDRKHQIFPCEYFTGKDFKTGQIKTTENTFAIHHYAGSWLSEEVKLSVKERWAFYEKYKNDDYVLKLYEELKRLKTKNVDNIGLKSLYKLVVKRTIKKILGEKIVNYIKNKKNRG